MDTKEILKRLELVKDIDPFNKQLLNDAHTTITTLQSEVDRLIYHNNNLMNVIYQNQHELENLDVPTGE